MKKNILTSIFLLSFAAAGAQVGITKSGDAGFVPTATLHVKGDLPNTANKPALRIENPTALANDVLTVGNSSTKLTMFDRYAFTKRSVLFETDGTNGVDIPLGKVSNAQTPFYYTHSYITLPPGRWLVNGSMLIRAGRFDALGNRDRLASNEGIWMRTTLSDATASGTSVASPDIETGAFMSGALMGPGGYSTLTGEVVINNKTNANKTYYYMASAQNFNITGDSPVTLWNFGSYPDGVANDNGNWEEDQLYALPLESAQAVIAAGTYTFTQSALLRAGVEPSGVTATANITVTQDGYYSIISDQINGVTFFFKGYLAKGSSVPLVLTAYGTPISAGVFPYRLEVGGQTVNFSVTVN